MSAVEFFASNSFVNGAIVESTEDCVSGTASLRNTFAARAEADPAPALFFCDSVVSFGELHASALRSAAALAAQGIVRGDVVALQMPKREDTYSLLLACLRLGAPYVFLDRKALPNAAPKSSIGYGRRSCFS